MINSFSPLFELAVALNFAYLASQTIRSIFEGGFLSIARNLLSKLDNRIKKISADLATTREGLFNEKAKEDIKNKFEAIRDRLKSSDESLDNKIKDVQNIISGKLKSIYIITAFYGLLVLFLGGQESLSEGSPYHSLYSVTIYIVLTISIIILYSFTKQNISIIFTISVTFIFMSYNLFNPMMSYSDEQESRIILVYISVAIAYSPFMITSVRLFLSSILEELKGWFFYLWSIIEIYFLHRKINKLINADKIFN